MVHVKTFITVAAAIATVLAYESSASEFRTPPGEYRTSWVSNTVPGGRPNGVGFRVQNGPDEIEVTPDGTAIAGTARNEAGHCVGLYKGGIVNRVPVEDN